MLCWTCGYHSLGSFHKDDGHGYSASHDAGIDPGVK
jgi:hypothetical protein